MARMAGVTSIFCRRLSTIAELTRQPIRELDMQASVVVEGSSIVCTHRPTCRVSQADRNGVQCMFACSQSRQPNCTNAVPRRLFQAGAPPPPVRDAGSEVCRTPALLQQTRRGHPQALWRRC